MIQGILTIRLPAFGGSTNTIMMRKLILWFINKHDYLVLFQFQILDNP